MSRTWTAVAAVVALAACSGQEFEPPARTLEVTAEEVRIAELLESRARGRGPAPEGGCAVRVLGIEGSTTYAWSTCEFRDPSGMSSGVSAPIRVEGTEVRSPADGGGYAESVRDMFPRAMAEAILTDQDRLLPRSP